MLIELFLLAPRCGCGVRFASNPWLPRWSPAGATCLARCPQGPAWRRKSWTQEQTLSLQNEIYWDDWSQLSIFRASKHSGSQVELLASQLTGLMDMKIFYKGKTAGKAVSPSSLGLISGEGPGVGGLRSGACILMTATCTSSNFFLMT